MTMTMTIRRSRCHEKVTNVTKVTKVIKVTSHVRRDKSGDETAALKDRRREKKEKGEGYKDKNKTSTSQH
ncbi:hypothetical protein V500_08066 [Pseudogymnoascus sp. VKM F-4518 (FW-2643)]|nr:hypothetical protein V500_08066 [Pseudogymnoascus sp. VKM F-4518 (FW-2643)]